MTRSASFAPVAIVEGARDRGLVLVADHARRELPDEYGDLGLPASEFDRHIAYDMIIVALIMIFVVWRTAAGWRHYAEFQTAQDRGEARLSLGAYFGLQLLGALTALTLAVAVLDRLI